MPDVVTLTMNPAVDKSAEVEHVERNKKLRCSGIRRDAGGGGINVSRAVRRLGGRSRAWYLSGGLNGQRLEGLVADDGVESRPIPIADTIRENFTVTETSSGSQYRFGMPGPTVLEDEWRNAISRVVESLSPGDFLVASGSLPPGVPTDFYARLGSAAADAEACYIVDTAGEALVAAVENGVFLVKPNIDELAALAGDDDMEGPEIREAAGELARGDKATHVVVSLGAGGALLVSRDYIEKVASPTVPIRSRIGAGDSMIGGIVYSLSIGRSISEAVRYGVAAGAAAVMTDGTELCRSEDVERLSKELG